MTIFQRRLGDVFPEVVPTSDGLDPTSRVVLWGVRYLNHSPFWVKGAKALVDEFLKRRFRCNYLQLRASCAISDHHLLALVPPQRDRDLFWARDLQTG